MGIVLAKEKGAKAVKRPRTATTRRITRQIIAKIPGFRTISRKSCPPGKILRKGYMRHYSTAVRRRGFTVKKDTGQIYRIHPSNKDMHVEATCVTDPNPGKKHTVKKQIGPLKKGELAMYGYSFRGKETDRHIALVKAIHEYTALGVFHKLDAVAKLTHRTLPKASSVFAKDREWVRTKFVSP
jgi:hypothetical protein